MVTLILDKWLLRKFYFRTKSGLYNHLSLSIKNHPILLSKLLQCFNNWENFEDEVLFLDKRISVIGGELGSIYNRVSSLSLRFDLLRFTAFPIFLLAIIVEEKMLDGMNKATKSWLTNFVPWLKTSCNLDLFFCFFKLGLDTD